MGGKRWGWGCSGALEAAARHVRVRAMQRCLPPPACSAAVQRMLRIRVRVVRDTSLVAPCTQRFKLLQKAASSVIAMQ